MFLNIPFQRVVWVTSSFLVLTAFLTITAVPAYLWYFGWDWFLFGLFLFYYPATAMSITVGYHRLFSHKAFKAKWPVKLITLLFGAATFENSALWWSASHRIHHKHVDQDDDPYDISKGFFWAHIGWLMFKLKPEGPMNNVQDLRKDRMVMWQHRWINSIAFTVGFVVPTILGYFYALYSGAMDPWVGALGGFLIPGVARTTMVQHGTFCINSLCHMIGTRPYSTECSARDSWIAAIFTMGEGYHNYHHEFQWDYRNGVKPWQLDPSKWIIWFCSKIGLASDLKRVPKERILLAETRETRRQLEASMLSMKESGTENDPLFLKAMDLLNELAARLLEICDELQKATHDKLALSKAKLKELRNEVRTMLAQIEKSTRIAFA
ncbi:MAG: acyl-CoA desaturase [Opitutae bacterium]|nr:acyl-CoA desaturase [Opitutae bacterium]|tara:strand:- start:945 stop:2084 length:1140 start_codon:yes stop_codon:yes gene_type:complete